MKQQRQVIASGRFIRLVKEAGWEYTERINITGIVVIVAITDDGRLVLTEQYRRPVHSHVLELPAGLVGDRREARNERMLDAARRELFEETGYRARRWRRLLDGPPTPGLSAELMTFYLAMGARKVGPGGGDASEEIIAHAVPLHTIEAWLKKQQRQGHLVDPKIYAGIFFALRAGRQGRPR